MVARRWLVLVLLLVVLAAVIAWQAGWLRPTPIPAPVASTPAPLPRFQSAWATEEEWLVDRIAHDVGELAAFAATRAVPTGAAAPVKPGTLRFEEHLFSPRSYEPIARRALGEAGAADKRPADSAREDARLASALLDLRSAVLVREDATLSGHLQAEPRDGAAHERAALLLGAFALRDSAGRSTDTRPALCRMTAHLALAAALRGDAAPGLAGRLAETVLVTLLGRERDAIARLDGLEGAAATATERAWGRALRLRNTGDWRPARNEKHLTLLERLEEFRALVRGQGDASALAWLDRGRPEPVPDWGLIALNADTLSVEAGNRFADFAPMLQLIEAGEVWNAVRGTPVDEAGLTEALDERPGRLVGRDPAGKAQLVVVGWGLWADRTQRHLLFELATGAYYHRYMLGHPGEGQAYSERSRERFGRLAMYPVVLRAHAGDAAQYRTAMAAVRELALRSPERLTGGHWQLFRFKEDFAAVPRDLPDENTWFQPVVPSGTLLDVGGRLELLREFQSIAPERLRALQEMAPYNLELALFAASRQPVEGRTMAGLAAVYGPLAGFNVRVMGKLADAAWYDPAGFRERQGALCEVVPERCFGLGYRLAEMGFPDEAAVAYQKGFDRANDRVLAANSSLWLVDYYFDHGQPKKAEAVAREAAATYSGMGLFVMAKLMERMGRLREAEEHYRRILDRYQSADELTGFYYRQSRVAGKAAYEPKLRDALALALPSGLEPLDRATLKAPPTDGVVIRKENDNTKRYGIHWGNVIVGVDGFRVHDLRAYDVVVGLSHAPRMKLVLWHGTSYDDVEVELWDRKFRVNMENLSPAK